MKIDNFYLGIFLKIELEILLYILLINDVCIINKIYVIRDLKRYTKEKSIRIALSISILSSELIKNIYLVYFK